MPGLLADDGGGRIDASLVRDVQSQETYVASVGGQFFGGAAAPAGVPRTQVHDVAGLGQLGGDRAADSLVGAGHQGDVVRHVSPKSAVWP